MLYNAAGYFLPSVLPSATRPSLAEFIIGLIAALTLLMFSFILINKGGEK